MLGFDFQLGLIFIARNRAFTGKTCDGETDLLTLNPPGNLIKGRQEVCLPAGDSFPQKCQPISELISYLHIVLYDFWGYFNSFSIIVSFP